MKRFFKLLASLAVTVVFGWWAFRDTHWDEQWASLRAAHYGWVIPYCAILLLIHLSRTARWGALLASQERVRFRALNDASAIGFMMLLVLPFRLGEFARPFLIAQRSSIRRSAAMTSVVLERIADGVFVALLLRGLLFLGHGDDTPVRLARYGANLMFAVFFGGFLFLLFAAWHHDQAVALVRGTLGRLSPALGERASDVVDSFVGALKQRHRPSELAAFVAWTFVYWGLNGFGMWVLMPGVPPPALAGADLRGDVPGGGGGDDSRGSGNGRHLPGGGEAGAVHLPPRLAGERPRPRLRQRALALSDRPAESLSGSSSSRWTSCPSATSPDGWSGKGTQRRAQARSRRPQSRSASG